MPPEHLGSNVESLDLAEMSLRDVNRALQSRNGTSEEAYFRVLHPQGAHALACGINAPIAVEIAGHAGYFCAGMNKSARIEVHGNAGQGVAENIMSGEVRVHGDASQCAGATGKGGLLVIDGNAGSRCGISLKGADIVVKGDVGHMSMFMAQAGTLVVLGDAGDSLGDSLYEARIFVRGQTRSLGTDCIEKEMRPEHLEHLQALLERAGCEGVEAREFRRYGSARQLYNFKIENVSAY